MTTRGGMPALAAAVALVAGAMSLTGATPAMATTHVSTWPSVAHGLRTAGPAASAFHAGRQFPGAGGCNPSGICYTPGEPVVAVGPNDIVETENDIATVYSKSGTKLATFDFASFWDNSGSLTCGDPRALYIPGSDRFAISCADANNVSATRFAISKTNDPTGAWWQYSPGPSDDQPKIVATSDKFIIAGNATGNVEDLYVYNLSDVLNGVASPTVVHLQTAQSNVYQAAVEQTLTSNAYFVDSFQGQGNPVWLATVSGTPAAGNVTLTERNLGAMTGPGPIEPAVPGGSIGGGVMDGRTLDAVYETETSDNKPVIQYSDMTECGTRVCAVSSRIDLSGATPVIAYEHVIGEPGFDDTYPAVGLDAAGDVFISYSRSDATHTPSAGVIGPNYDVILQPNAAGTTTCASGSGPCDERWGDYLGTAIDPSTPTSVWLAGLYQAGNGGFSWGTVVSKVSTTTFTLPAVTTGAASSITETSATIAGTVNPRGVATTYHVDYGLTTGYDSRTSETAAGSGSSAVPVSVPLSGLAAGTKYHYRVVATTATGSALGTDHTFTTLPPPPAITKVTPNTGPQAGRQTVVIKGTALTGATAVSFGGTPAASFVVNSSKQITAVTAAAPSAGTVDVTVTTPGGTSATVSTDHYTFIAITSVVFSGGSANPVVTITGAGFGSRPAANPSTPPCGATTGLDYGPTGLWVSDTTQGFTAGQGPGDCVGLVITSYTSTKIVLGMGDSYGTFGPSYFSGDAFTIEVKGVGASGVIG